MTHRYSHVARHTHTFYAEQRDFLNLEEWREARRKDAQESECDKAWRNIMTWHRNITYQIMIMQRAMHDMGVPLTVSGRTRVENMLRYGQKWYDTRPDVTFTTASKNLLNNLAALAEAWKDLRAAEAKEKDAIRQDRAPISQNPLPDEKQSATGILR